MVRLKPWGTILNNPLRLLSAVESLQFCVSPVSIGLVIDVVTGLKCEGLDVFSLNFC